MHTLTCAKCDVLYLEFEVQGHTENKYEADAVEDTPPSDGETKESNVGDTEELRMECPKCENTEEELFQKTVPGDRIYKIRCLTSREILVCPTHSTKTCKHARAPRVKDGGSYLNWPRSSQPLKQSRGAVGSFSNHPHRCLLVRQPNRWKIT